MPCDNNPNISFAGVFRSKIFHVSCSQKSYHPTLEPPSVLLLIFTCCWETWKAIRSEKSLSFPFIQMITLLMPSSALSLSLLFTSSTLISQSVPSSVQMQQIHPPVKNYSPSQRIVASPSDTLPTAPDAIPRLLFPSVFLRQVFVFPHLIRYFFKDFFPVKSHTRNPC